jgi:uncharacterized protein YecA (UPF0149 family)
MPGEIRRIFGPGLQQLVHPEAQKFEAPSEDSFLSEEVTPVKTAYQPASPTHPKVGRNDPCPCQSGKKYKKCCGK